MCQIESVCAPTSVSTQRALICIQSEAALQSADFASRRSPFACAWSASFFLQSAIISTEERGKTVSNKSFFALFVLYRFCLPLTHGDWNVIFLRLVSHPFPGLR
ncbi:hypothetical protein L596_005388 [Steinernema carpocapsae]|uniref:Uncharacterized protein n=1 Tax=Steinernema carpocapsae TaxID=34508 RepID=A0A4U8UYY4_STECR|nr:hypothetical protein L596_005388 [Steinernema carpocapsae]